MSLPSKSSQHLKVPLAQPWMTHISDDMLLKADQSWHHTQISCQAMRVDDPGNATFSPGSDSFLHYEQREPLTSKY